MNSLALFFSKKKTASSYNHIDGVTVFHLPTMRGDWWWGGKTRRENVGLTARLKQFSGSYVKRTTYTNSTLRYILGCFSLNISPLHHCLSRIGVDRKEINSRVMLPFYPLLLLYILYRATCLFILKSVRLDCRSPRPSFLNDFHPSWCPSLKDTLHQKETG